MAIHKYIAVIAIAWMTAHIIKALLGRQKATSKGESYNFFRSGGMPSAHTATTVALATLIGLSEGLASPIFALALLFALVVMHDARGVRHSNGQNSQAINSLIKESKSTIEKPAIVLGHTIPEIIGGIILGVAIAMVVFFATN